MGVWGVPRLTILISLHWQLFVLAEAFSSRSSYYAPSVDDSISTKPKLKVRGNPIPNLNGTCPPPNAGSWCNDGDADAFNDTEIAGYLGDLLIPDQFWVSLKDESPSYETGDERTNKLWATMLEQGKVIKGWLDKYAGPKRNRLDALLDGGSSSDVVTKFYEYYNPERTADVTLEGGGMTGRAKINEPLELSVSLANSQRMSCRRSLSSSVTSLPARSGKVHLALDTKTMIHIHRTPTQKMTAASPPSQFIRGPGPGPQPALWVSIHAKDFSSP